MTFDPTRNLPEQHRRILNAMITTGRRVRNEDRGRWDVVYTAPDNTVVCVGGVSFECPPSQLDRAVQRVWTYAMEPFLRHDPSAASGIILPSESRLH